MKITEFKKLIREEVRKVMNEAKTWDKKSIEKFFKYLADNHGMKSKPEFKTDTSGRIQINGMPAFDAKFMVDGNNLVFSPTSDSDMTAQEFVEDIEYDGAKGYTFKVEGKFAIVN